MPGFADLLLHEGRCGFLIKIFTRVYMVQFLAADSNNDERVKLD